MREATPEGPFANGIHEEHVVAGGVVLVALERDVEEVGEVLRNLEFLLGGLQRLFLFVVAPRRINFACSNDTSYNVTMASVNLIGSNNRPSIAPSR